MPHSLLYHLFRARGGGYGGGGVITKPSCAFRFSVSFYLNLIACVRSSHIKEVISIQIYINLKMFMYFIFVNNITL